MNSLTFTVPASSSGGRFCVNVSTIDDMKVEGTEQFELFFENVPSATTTLGNPGSVCVNIADNDGKNRFIHSYLDCETPTNISIFFFILAELNVSFERDQYTVNENDGSVQVCFLTNIGHSEDVLVTVEPVDKPGAQYPAAGRFILSITR